MKRRLAILCLITPLLLSQTEVRACPMCKETQAETDSQSETQVSAAFNYSILGMLGAVFATAGFVGRTLYKASRHPSQSRGS